MIGKKGKFLIASVSLIILLNLCNPIISYGNPTSTPVASTPAASTLATSTPVASTPVASSTPATNTSKSEESGLSSLGNVLDWGVGTLLIPLRLLIYAFAEVINTIITGISGSDVTVNVETILFNKVELVNINFFDFNSSQPFVKTLRENVATWYYTIRNIAIIASLCVLIYIAIRMATSTIASDRAEYKRLLKDWLVGFILIFVLHYIIILTITINNTLVDILYQANNSGGTSASVSELTTYTEAIGDKAITVVATFTESFTAAIVYLILLCIALAFLIMYIKRMIVLAFLIIIAPLITVTYAIDKVKDNSSQALNTWLKEFIWTILIQPFHCLIYLVFVTISFESLQSQTVSAALLSIMCMLFIMQAEDIVKKIFGIQADNVGKMSGAMALAAGGLLASSKVSGKGTKAVGGKVAGKAGEMLNKIPQVKNAAGAAGAVAGAVGSAANATTSFAQKVSNVVDSPKVQTALNGFKNVMNNTVVGKATKKLGNMAVSYGKWSVAAVPKIIGATAAMTTAQGDLGKIYFGYKAGETVGNYVGDKAKNVYQAGSNKFNDVIETRRTRNAVNNLKNSYAEMQSNKKLTKEQLNDKAGIYLNMDINSETFKKVLKDYEQRFVATLKTVQNQLIKTGQDSSIENILNKIHTKDTHTLDKDKDSV